MKMLVSFFFLLFFTAHSSAQKVNLQLNLAKGNTYFHTINGDSKITQTIDGKEINIDFGLQGTVSYEILDTIDTVYVAKVRYKKLKMILKVQGKTLQFNSDATENSDQLSKVLTQLIDIPFSVEMSKRGELIKVGNIDSIFKSMINIRTDLNEEQKQQMLTQLLKAYGEKAFMGNFNMITAMYPSKKISKGEKWVIKTKMEVALAADLETTYELIGIEDKYYQVRGTSTMKTIDKDAYIQVNGMPVKYDLTGLMITNLKISKETGWIIDGTIEQEMSGKTEFKDTEQVPGGMIVPIIFTNDLKVSGN